MLTQYSVFLYAECVNALGMESGAISDGQMTASSQYNSYYAARLGRLHLKASGGYSGGWLSGTTNQNQWLMVDMGHQNTIVTAVATQGRDATNQWVKTYKLQHRVWSGGSYQYYREQGQSVDKVRQT